MDREGEKSMGREKSALRRSRNLLNKNSGWYGTTVLNRDRRRREIAQSSFFKKGFP